jgi:energy-coupling factor transporter ATP-binding protein EcfA2
MAILPFRLGRPRCILAFLIHTISFTFPAYAFQAFLPDFTQSQGTPSFVSSARLRQRSRHLSGLAHAAIDQDGTSSAGARAAPRHRITPSTVTLDSVSLQFPRTFTRRLFASDPHRDHALRNVTLTINSTTGNFVLLTGASSSGKSALMNVIRGRYQPTSGSVIVSSPTPGASDRVCRTAKPVYLDDPRRDTHRDESFQSVGAILDRHVSRVASGCDAAAAVVRPLVDEVSRRLRLNLSAERRTVKPCDLSQSESYRFGLLLACVESMLGGLEMSPSSSFVHNQSYEPEDDRIDETHWYLPAPILLLDEVRITRVKGHETKLVRVTFRRLQSMCAIHSLMQWLDKEGTSVVRNVQLCLESLTKELGAVICTATHKPERYRMPNLSDSIESKPTATKSRLRRVTMRSGQIVSDPLRGEDKQ